MASMKAASRGPVTPVGVNHIALNVRNMDESHQFWTEIVGLKLVGEFRQRPGRPPTPRMQFYSGNGTDGATDVVASRSDCLVSSMASRRLDEFMSSRSLRYISRNMPG